jgi:hypothetical protein
MTEKPKSPVEESTKHRWLRTKYIDWFSAPSLHNEPIALLRAVRDDGAMFTVWAPLDEDCDSPMKMREVLDRMLDNPVQGIFADADEKTREKLRKASKGNVGWVEEPEHSDD